MARPIDLAFERALQLLQKHSDLSTRWCSADDVVQHIRIAQERYSNRRNVKASKWLIRLSEKVIFYSQVLDVVAQHHPEYVSLAWGAFKFVFMGVLNHETMIKELAKAMARIADAVKNVETQRLLYPSVKMSECCSDLYSHIMTFATRAIEWYEKGKVAHVVAAFTSPFQLKFRDIVDEIHETSRKIDRLTMSESQAEIRRIHDKLICAKKDLEVAQAERREVYHLLTEVRGYVLQYGQLNQAGILDTNQRLSQVQLSQILSFMSDSCIPRADIVKQYYAARSNRRRKQGVEEMSYQSWISHVQAWGEMKTSGQIFVQGSFKTRHTARDFTVDAIDLITQAGIPVVWALDPSTESLAGNQFNACDVLKYLACQVLKSDNILQTEKYASLNAARFQSATTEAEWVDILACVLQGVGQIYIIVDTNFVARAGSAILSWLSYFSIIENTLRSRNIQIVMKIAFVSTCKAESGCIPQDIKVVRLNTTTSGRISKPSSKSQRMLRTRGRKRLASALLKGTM
ncbi:hypothetical protein GGR57DRAFT_388457 [Xylariaceae sp. FL1272]|nr:hypothetical protein GGR57DRAFT_388457 [Xylariaceae sp. FL1272]